MKKNIKQKKSILKPIVDNNYFLKMTHAAPEGKETGILMLLPVIFFSSFVILIVRQYNYTRPMGQFFWTPETNTSSITDFFSYYKMLAIVLCAALVLIMLIFKITTQSLTIKRTYAYIPMSIYAFFVILSYIFSDYKEFSWLGWNERFEGTLVLLSYMVMLFFIINAVKTENDVRAIILPLAFSSTVLSLLGISQALGFDFFRTSVGQKLIVSNLTLSNGSTMWESIDAATAKGEPLLSFAFQNKEVYQTVYNPNYVSFYLTLLIPLFGMLFILSFNKGKNEKPIKTIGLAVLFALIVYNLIGSSSSGGFLGVAVIGLMGLIVLNKKLLQWIRPLLILFVITGLVAGLTSSRWLPEITRAVRGVLGNHTTEDPSESEDLTNAEPGSIKPVIDYIKTNLDSLELSINGEVLTLQLDSADSTIPPTYTLFDAAGHKIETEAINETKDNTTLYALNDSRFRPYLTLKTVEDIGYFSIVINTDTAQWYFPITSSGIFYLNNNGKFINLRDVPDVGFENNPNFGTWRGYIWSRSFPLLENSIFIGTGADTFAPIFPQDDYAGKYSTRHSDFNIVVDKPHNLYIHAWIGTGGISLLALLALYGIYLAQSFALYRKTDFDKAYLEFVGAGIFFGIAGFLVAALVNDSSVSVMPMFYGLLGLGIAVNTQVKKVQIG